MPMQYCYGKLGAWDLIGDINLINIKYETIEKSNILHLSLLVQILSGDQF